MDIQLPDGTLLTGVPEGTTKAQIIAKLGYDPSGSSPAQNPIQEEQPGIIDRAASAVENRGNQMHSALANYQAGNKNLPELGLNLAGKSAGLMSDLSGEILKSAFGALPNGVQDTLKTGATDALSAIGSIPLGSGPNTVGSVANSALQAYGDFAQNNPRTAEAIGDAANIGGVFTGLTSNPATRGAGSALEALSVAPVKSAGRGAARAITPSVEAETAKLAARADQFGIPLRLDQVAPTRARKTVQKVSQELPFSGVDSFEEGQRVAFNKALASTLGEQADNLGPETVQNFLKNASSKFNDTLKGETISVKDGDFAKLDDILADADLSMTGELKGLVSKNVDALRKDIGGNTIPGEKLASFRSQLIKRIPKAPAESKQALAEIVDTIDGMVERSVTPEKVDVLKTARREWRNFKTLEPLLEKAEGGLINPTQLMQRVAASPYIKASRASVGEDDLVDLARIGKQFLPKAGGSDTFQKLALGGTGVATLANPATGLSALGAMAGNRAFQSLYNQNPALVRMAVERGSGSPLFLENSALKKLGTKQ